MPAAGLIWTDKSAWHLVLAFPIADLLRWQKQWESTRSGNPGWQFHDLDVAKVDLRSFGFQAKIAFSPHFGGEA